MAKSKRKPLSLKRPKRMLPKNNEGGVNPLLVGAGAAAGYKAGGAISNRKRQASARRSVVSSYGSSVRGIANDANWSAGIRTGNDVNASDREKMRAAETVYRSMDSRMPSASDVKIANRKQYADAMYSDYVERKGSGPLGRDYDRIGKKASKAANLTRAEQKIYEARKAVSRRANRATTAKEMLDAATDRKRIARGTTGASRRSRVAGGLTGAALTTLAQLVAQELKKKR